MGPLMFNGSSSCNSVVPIAPGPSAAHLILNVAVQNSGLHPLLQTNGTLPPFGALTSGSRVHCCGERIRERDNVESARYLLDPRGVALGWPK